MIHIRQICQQKILLSIQERQIKPRKITDCKTRLLMEEIENESIRKL